MTSCLPTTMPATSSGCGPTSSSASACILSAEWASQRSGAGVLHACMQGRGAPAPCPLPPILPRCAASACPSPCRKYRLPIWLTEFACPNPGGPSELSLEFMVGLPWQAAASMWCCFLLSWGSPAAASGASLPCPALLTPPRCLTLCNSRSSSCCCAAAARNTGGTGGSPEAARQR